MTGLVVDVVGWTGAGALLSAYAFVSSGRLQGRGLGFQLLNLLGAVGLLVNGVYHEAWPSAGLNAVWLVVGVAALVRLLPQPVPPPTLNAVQAAVRPEHRLDRGRTAGPLNLGATNRCEPQEPA